MRSHGENEEGCMRKMAVAIVFAAALGIIFCGMMYAADKAAAASGDKEQVQIMPKKVTADTNYDGKTDRTEYYDAEGRVQMVEIDSDGDGIVDETIIYKDGKPVKSARDTNRDGKPDVWVEF
jgi:hypothetical protein